VMVVVATGGLLFPPELPPPPDGAVGVLLLSLPHPIETAATAVRIARRKIIGQSSCRAGARH
jgi:hypothetical protein